MSQLVFDERTAKQIEALYGIDDAVRRRRIVRHALRASAGDRILDVGCGPGFYCFELLGDIGVDGSVVGVDASEAMLKLAAARCAGCDNVELLVGDALSLPVEDASFDAAVCVQVLEYVTDVAAALREMHRALRPDGRLVVWDVDWATLSIWSEDLARMERVLRAWDEHLAHPSLPRTLAPKMAEAGFTDVRMDAYAFATIDGDPRCDYSAAVLPTIRAFVAGLGALTDEESEAWLEEQRQLGRLGEFYASVTQFCFSATKKP